LNKHFTLKVLFLKKSILALSFSLLTLVVLSAFVSPLVSVSAISASPVCGMTITKSLTLKGNLGPCPANGINIAGSTLTLNCNGFKIISSGSGIGVDFLAKGSVFHVIVKNCIVTGFGVGISTGQCNLLFSSCFSNSIMNNRILKSKGDGFFLVSHFQNNFLTGNSAKYNGGFGFDDMSTGQGTAKTANTYSSNHCTSNTAGPSSPAGLC
jgi:parallel beta-helix repeat protein